MTGVITPRHPPPPPELVPILKTYCKVFVTGTDHHPPPWNVDDVTQAMSKGVVLVNVQEWGCFSIFRRADDVTQTMSKGGGGVLVECLHPPPSGNPLSAPVICVKFRANQPLCPPPLTKAFPYAYAYAQ